MPSPSTSVARRCPFGAELVDGGAHLRAWAPACRRLEAAFEDGRTFELSAEPGGFFSGSCAGRRAGDRYRLRLDGGDLLPDPASRFQPEGPHGPSELVDPAAFAWTDASWRGLSPHGQALYELHVGTFTREGTWRAAARRLPELAELGVTAVEVMPVAETPGRFNWGYDGVDLYAPASRYGRPDELRAFVDRAHALRLGVLLDVVYNHLGPDGNYLARLAPPIMSRRHRTEWGEALNYDGEDSGPVRDFMAANGAYWIDEYHLDGLRLDATQNIHDESRPRFLCELAGRARAAAPRRGVLIIAESETQDTSLVAAPERGGCGFDGVWNDDYHHAMRVALTGRREAYLRDYLGSPQELLSCLKRGYLYQGQWYGWQRKGRGTPTAGVPSSAFVTYLENHDQVANTTPRGLRLRDLTSPGRLRAATGVLLLGPGTPLLFQGQERGSRAGFTFFADHAGELGDAVAKGRRAFMAQFPSMADPEAQAAIPDPRDEEAMRRCCVEEPEDAEARRWLALHRDLLAIRRRDPVIAAQRGDGLDGAVLGPAAFCARFFAEDGGDRLLLVNLGAELELGAASEPLLAPPPGRRWETVWSSDDARYGGPGTVPLDPSRWRLQAESARLQRAGEGDVDAAA